jgi:hypothetical protein
MNDLLALGAVAYCLGVVSHYTYRQYRGRHTHTRLELVEQNVALTILTSAALGRLSPEQKAAVQEQAQERLTDAFGHADIDIEGATDE